MAIRVIDFETYYDSNYSLSKLQTDEYILDPRFEIILVGLDDKWFSGTHDEIRNFILINSDPVNDTFVAHNAIFDGFILTQILKIFPARWVDTLGMARAVLPELKSHGLAALAKYYGLEDKGTYVADAKGKTRAQFTPIELQSYAAYCLHDVKLTHALYERLLPFFPPQELAILDMTIRMFTEPKLLLDADTLDTYHKSEIKRKEDLLAACTADKSELMSNAKFAEKLQDLGITPPLKISARTGKETFAFAKSDKEFVALLEHENPEVQALVAARLGVKSTIAETRALRLLQTAQRGTGRFPVALNYWGAATTGRLSGGNQINCMHPDIEVLSREGWVRVEDWIPTQGIMQWWPSGELSWCDTATKVYREDSELVWFNSPFVRGGFTKDHRFVHYSDGFRDKTAGWIHEHSGLDEIPLSGLLQQKGTSTLTQEQVRFLVAVAADGTIKQNKHSRTLIFGFRKSRKINRMQELLCSLNMPFTRREYPTQTRFYCRQIPAWITKGFGAWVLQLSSEAMDALLDEIIYWDGGAHSKTSNVVFYTTDIEQAKWVATIAHLRNKAGAIYRYSGERYSTGEVCHVYFRSRPFSSIARRHIETKEYSGMTYCPSVNSSYVLARYDNRIFVTGQCQNIPARGAGSELRKAIIAPPGHLVVVGDSSNIELRVAMACAGQTDAIDKLRAGEDLYCDFASKIYHREITKDDKPERFLGKVAMLSLQYGAGAPKFREIVRLLAKQVISEEEANRIVWLYREVHSEIHRLWARCDNVVLPAINNGRLDVYVDVNKWFWTVGEGFSHPPLPGVKYTDLRRDQMSGQWSYQTRNGRVSIYGGKVVENLCQHMARHVVMWQTAAINEVYPVALSVHDEVVCVVPEDSVDACVKYMTAVLSTAPAWCRDKLPVACEVGYGRSYGAAK